MCKQQALIKVMLIVQNILTILSLNIQNTFTPYHTFQNRVSPFLLPLHVSEKSWMSDKQCNPDQMPHFVSSDLGSHYLLRMDCSKYLW